MGDLILVEMQGHAALAEPCLGEAFLLLADFWVVPVIPELQPPGQDQQHRCARSHSHPVAPASTIRAKRGISSSRSSSRNFNPAGCPISCSSRLALGVLASQRSIFGRSSPRHSRQLSSRPMASANSTVISPSPGPNKAPAPTTRAPAGKPSPTAALSSSRYRQGLISGIRAASSASAVLSAVLQQQAQLHRSAHCHGAIARIQLLQHRPGVFAGGGFGDAQALRNLPVR